MNENRNLVLGVIPARGGSKRLPRKNILECGGKPLIAHTIEAASSSKKITDTIFSTDDAEIREIAQQYGAYAPFLRPRHLATDETTNKHVMMHALTFMEEQKKKHYHYIVLLQPTAPLRTPEQIDSAIDIISDSEYPTLASVSGPHKKRHQIIKKPIGNNAATIFDNFAHTEFYIFDASIYIVNRDYFSDKFSIFSDPHAVYVNNDMHVDVDDEGDLFIANAILNERNRKL